MKRLIIFLIRKKFGLKKGQHFKFANQTSKTDYYKFTKTRIIKIYNNGCRTKNSNVSLNWLLNDNCKIIKLENKDE